MHIRVSLSIGATPWISETILYVDLADLVRDAILDTLCVEPDEVVPTAMFVADLHGHWCELMTILGQLGSSLDLDVERFQLDPHVRHGLGGLSVEGLVAMTQTVTTVAPLSA